MKWPEDIPADIWETVCRTVIWGGEHGVRTAIAQEVMAERERCARVAEELWLGAPLYAEGKDIAAVIRVGAKTK